MQTKGLFDRKCVSEESPHRRGGNVIHCCGVYCQNGSPLFVPTACSPASPPRLVCGGTNPCSTWGYRKQTLVARSKPGQMAFMFSNITDSQVGARATVTQQTHLPQNLPGHALQHRSPSCRAGRGCGRRAATFGGGSAGGPAEVEKERFLFRSQAVLVRLRLVAPLLLTLVLFFRGIP